MTRTSFLALAVLVLASAGFAAWALFGNPQSASVDSPSLSDPGWPVGGMLQTPTVSAEQAVSVDEFELRLREQGHTAAEIIDAVESGNIDAVAGFVSWDDSVPCIDGTRSNVVCHYLDVPQGTSVRTLRSDGIQTDEGQILNELEAGLARAPRLLEVGESVASGELFLAFSFGPDPADDRPDLTGVVLQLEAGVPGLVSQVHYLAGASGSLAFMSRERTGPGTLDDPLRIIATSDDARWLDQAVHEADVRCRTVPPESTETCSSAIEWPNGTWPSRTQD